MKRIGVDQVWESEEMLLVTWISRMWTDWVERGKDAAEIVWRGQGE